VPKIDIAKATVRTKGVYPEPWCAITEGREKAALGDVVGLTQFGVNLTHLKPGAASALRHWHEAEDEFVYVLEGEIMLIEDGGTTVLQRATLRVSRLGSPTAIISSISRNATRSILRSARVPSVSGRIIPMSISFSTGTRAAFAFHAGQARRTRKAVDETSHKSRHFACPAAR
jgi:uncharacterized cupin superfamily protein